jgi:hypothetical protein
VVQDKKISKRKSIFKYIDFKLMILYPGIILSSGWTILNIVKIVGFVDQLKLEKPECTQPNPDKHLIFGLTILILFLLKDRIELNSANFFNASSVVPYKKFPQDSEARKSKSHMLGERVFKLIVNVFCVGFLLKIMMQPDCDFMDIRIGGN